MTEVSQVTFTTIADRGFVWGVLLLLASIRRSGLQNPVHVFLSDSDPEMARWVGQFEHVRVFDLDVSLDTRNPAVRKPDAILSAQTEYSAWIDADCMVIGDVSELLVPPNGQFQIRFCSEAENRFLCGVKCGNRYGPEDGSRDIPEKILEVWRRDVGENGTSAIRTLCQADCFVIHRNHFNFIERWREQMNRVIPTLDRNRTVDPASVAYFMIDMSVLSSLLAYSNDAPPCGEYLLNRDSRGCILHFGARPKPWEQWSVRHYRHFDRIAASIAWMQEKGYELPPVPWHMRPEWKVVAGARAYARAASYRVLNFLRIGRKWNPEA